MALYMLYFTIYESLRSLFMYISRSKLKYSLLILNENDHFVIKRHRERKNLIKKLMLLTTISEAILKETQYSSIILIEKP